MQPPAVPAENGNLINRQGALRIALIYAVFAALWILLSDQAVGLIFKDPVTMTQASIIKGWLFVAVTGLLLYVLVGRLVRQLQEAHRRQTGLLMEKQRSLDLLAAISDHSEDAIFAKDLDGRYILFNRAASGFVGKSAADILGRDDLAIFPAEQAKMLMDIGRRVIASGRAETNEEALDTAQGRRIFLATKGPLRTPDGSVVGIFGISRDISERKRAEISLYETSERLRLLVDHSPAAVAMFDRDMRYLIASKRWLMDFGVTGCNIIGRSHYDLFPEIGEELRDIHRRGLAGEVFQPKDGGFVRANGCVQWLRWSQWPWFQFDGSIGGIVIFAEEITDRKLAELSLAESEKRFHDIVEASADWVWEVDAQGRYTYVSDSIESLLGYLSAEILGRTPFDLMPANEAARVGALFAAIAARKEPFRDLDHINVHKDGSLRHVWSNGMPILAPDGTLLGYRGLDRDITSRKMAEQELRNTKDMLRVVINTIPDLIWLKDLEGRYLACNSRFEAFFGATEADIVGKTDFDFVPSALAEFFREKDQAALAANTSVENEEEIVFASDGHREHLLTIKTPYRDSQGTLIGVLGIARDMTERKAAEQSLIARNRELERFNRAMIGREMDVIEMKKVINALSQELGREPPYPLAFMKQTDGKSAP
ncbi:MAG: PAS domain S-box protein [Candidatus Accumulibacter cognatus]|uniref:histidine kinase n=1 Tax=Candidatus Accumulibacter cognatus TaxID=2954383 RepID=A0A7D5SW24_9PROT|nr:MAG: PAS domain S-box protein [Candidatus Accumulibacter cognatus]